MPPDVRFENFQIDNGEATRATTSLFQDSRGLMWFGTETGLYSYDGTIYNVYPVIPEINTGISALVGYNVLNIFEDSERNIWATTEGAINKFDRRTRVISHYIPDTTDFGSDNNKGKIVGEDSRGFLWMVTYKNVFSFEKKTGVFKEYKIDSLQWDLNRFWSQARQFLEDEKGRIWISAGSGLFVFNPSDNTFKEFFRDLDTRFNRQLWVQDFMFDKYGSIWVATINAGIIKITDPENGKYEILALCEGPFKKAMKDFLTTSAIFMDSSGKIWACGTNTIARIGPEDMAIEEYTLPEDPERKAKGYPTSYFFDKIYETSPGTIWFIEYKTGRILQFNTHQNLMTLYRLPEKLINQCIKDNADCFWFACSLNNVWRMITQPLSYYSVIVKNETSPDPTRYQVILEDNKHTLWLVLSSGIYTVSDFSTGSTFSLKGESLPGLGKYTKVTSVFQDRKGILWFGTNEGFVLKYESGVYTKLDFLWNEFYKPGNVAMIDEDSNGFIYFCTLFNSYVNFDGIFRLDPGSSKITPFKYFYDFASGPDPVYNLTDLKIDKFDNVWVTRHDGLLRISKDKNPKTDFLNVPEKGKVFSSKFVRIAKDKGGNIWALNSLSGLYYFDDNQQKLVHIELNKNYSPLNFLDLQFGENGLLYIAHNKGITIFNTATGTRKEVKVKKGMISAQSGLLNNGQVCFLCDNELIFLNDSISLNRHVPPVIFTKILVNEANYNSVFPDSRDDINSVKEIRLKHNQNSVHFEFAALNYLDSKYNSYRYFMNGIDDDTVTSGTVNSISYKKLRSGYYTFWATGSNNDGIWNKEGIKLNIYVKPPFYSSKIALFIYLISAISLIGFYVKLRTLKIIAEKRVLENEVRLRTEELHVKNIQLEEMDKLKTRFFTDISHEIRTPLSLILGPLETLVSEDHTDDHTGNLLGVMKRNGIRLTQLVNQMLDISRLDSGKMKIHLAESDIRAFLRILVYEFVSMAESRKIKYLVELPEKPCPTFFDRDKLEKIIVNLLSNAFKFTEPGGVVTCRVKIIYDHENKNAESMVITISDTGPGIDSENLEKIFDRFFKVEENHDPVKGGTGIGLSITKDMINVLHGKIEVASEKDKGTVFEVSIPLGLAHLKDDEFVITDQLSPSNNNHLVSKWKEFEALTNHNHESSKYRILLIEDNDDLRNFILGSLEEEYEVSVAENGKIGLNLGISLMPDLIVTDIKMDGIDGLTVCRSLKNDERTSHIPVIILTAKATTEEKIEGLSTGADDYLVKPFNMSELKIRIANLLEQREKLKNRYSIANGALLPLGVQESIDDKFLKKVVTVINERMHDFAFDVRELQEELGMSRMHLFRKLKALTGIPPVTLIRNMRLEKAAKLLAQKSGNITEIANSVGISNPSYFAKCFRDNFGVSPKDYNNGFKGADHVNGHKL